MAGFDKLYLITSENYDTMKNTGSVVIGGETYNYDDEALYFTDKLSTELLDDTNSTKKFTTAANIAAWNAKQEALVGDSSSASQNIKTVSGINIMGTGDVAVLKGIKINSGAEITPTNYVVSLPMDTTVTENSNSLVSSGAVFTAVQAVREVAEGKTKSYAISYADNAAFNTTADSISGVTSITDTASHTIAVSTLKMGDNVYVTETDVPDRWYNATDGKFYKLESAKMSDYATVAQMNAKNYIATVSAGSEPVLASGYLQFVVSNVDIPQADRKANTLYVILSN